MSTGTVRLHRVLRATPEKIYRAFLDSDAMPKWLPPNGFTGKVHHMDAKVGGTYQMSFTNFTTEPPRRNGNDGNPEEGLLRHRGEHSPRRDTRSHSTRGLLSWLARIAHPSCAARRS
jgi:hypothetical protein